ncbi:MAG TPA: arylsulfatase [Armatimonadota bacterium]|nr:arylsulfatase [Armatimonadota bacterium]
MADDRPNIILYTTDQHRGDYIGLSGYPVIETPNLDSWVNQGAYFPNAYTEIPSTTGARRCLLGGQGSYDCGLIGYAGAEWHEPNTVAQVLADQGYHCINVGWRNLHPRRKLYGFHSVIPHDLSLEDDDYLAWLKQQVGPEATERGHGVDSNGWLARPWHLEERLHPTVWTTDVALDQLKKRDPTRPVFIWISHLRPHSPYDPPEFFWDMYINRELPPVPVGDWAEKYETPQPGVDRTAWHGKLTPEQDQRGRTGYMGCITHIDYELGRLMEELAKQRLLNDSLWLFTSDHGDMMGDHHLHRKTYAYEGSARIPFVVRYPAGVDLPTGTFDNVVGLQDVMPTILDSAGVDIPDSVTGTSVLDVARGKPWREYIHGEHSPCYATEPACQYLTDGKEKYIWFPATGEEQLFDLVNDRDELQDLSQDPAMGDRVVLWRQRLIEKLDRGDGFSDGEKLIVRTERWGPEVAK